MEQLFLDRLPTGIILVEGNTITGYNQIASRLFPQLLKDNSENWLTQEFSGQAGMLSSLDEKYCFEKVESQEGYMIILTREEENKLSSEQVWGIFYQIRDQLTNIELGMRDLCQLPQGKDSLENMFKSLTQLQRLIDNGELLQLEELDMPLDTLDFAGLSRQLCNQIVPFLQEIDVVLIYDEIPATLLVEGNGHYLRKMLLGLVCNYAREGEEIQITMKRGKLQGILSIKSGGTGRKLDIGGILAGKHSGMIPKIGEGAGLGFPVIRRIVGDMGGTLLAEEGDTGGLEITIALPLGKQNAFSVASEGRKQRSHFEVDRSGGISDILLELSPVLKKAAFDLEELADS